MAKTLKKKNPSKKQEKSSIFSYLRSIVDTKIFSGKINLKSLSIYLGISFLIFLIIGAIKSSIIDSSSSILLNSLYILILIPIVFFLFYIIFYVFLNAFEDKRKKLLESFLVFFAIIIPFMIIGNFISLLNTLSLNSIYGYFILLLTSINLIYLIINLVFSFKNYYNTSGFKVFTSLILTEILFGVLALVQYLSILITSLK